MKTLILLFSLAFVGILSVSAQRTQDKAQDDGAEKESKFLIDPSASILGFAIGTPEGDLMKELGRPDGYLWLDQNKTAAIYENSYAYIFTKEKLSGIRISYSLIDQPLVLAASDIRDFPQPRWELDNGIKSDMTLESVRKILGDRLKQDPDLPSKHEQFYEVKGGIVTLYFWHFGDEGDSDSGFRLKGLLLKRTS